MHTFNEGHNLGVSLALNIALLTHTLALLPKPLDVITNTNTCMHAAKAF